MGSSRTASAISKRLEEKGVRIERTASPDATDAALTGATRAVFVVPPIPDVSIERFAERFRAANPTLPLYVAMRGPIPDKNTKRLYRGGVQALFEWPADKEPLLRTAFRLAGSLLSIEPGASMGSDLALEELVNGHLRTAPTRLPPTLGATVRHRFAILSGVVDALYQVHVAERVAAEVPGVEDVVSVGVRVGGDETTDRAIHTAVRQVLKYASRVDVSTLAWRVSEGTVTLSGVAEGRDELTRTLQLIESVRGVKAIENFVTVSVKGKQQGRAIAKRVRAALALRSPKTSRPKGRGSLEVAVFGGVVVLSGQAETAAHRATLVELAAGQEGVERVVDKLRVRKPR